MRFHAGTEHANLRLSCAALSVDLSRSPKGLIVAGGYNDKFARLWDVETGRVRVCCAVAPRQSFLLWTSHVRCLSANLQATMAKCMAFNSPQMGGSWSLAAAIEASGYGM